MATSAAPSTAALSDLTGIWTVIGHYMPGISAMTDADAAARNGETVRLTTTQAISPDTHCAQPTYATRTVARDSFLAVQFHLPPGSLAPLAPVARLTVLEVSCGGAPWAAMGGRLIQIDSAHVLLAFSCTCQDSCPSCHAKRLAIRTRRLDTTLLAPVPHRHVVLTIHHAAASNPVQLARRIPRLTMR